MWNRLAGLPFAWRCLLKWLLLILITFFTLYPHPGLFLKQIRHFRDVESLIQPDLPEIAAINQEIDDQLAGNGSRKDEFKTVERYVYQRIPYKFDWFNWGNLDYWPTAQEVLARQTEDCDGRAVLATSILRSRGFKTARIVANLNHVWVTVDNAELMGPQPDKNYRRVGEKMVISMPQLRTWLAAISKISKFPAVRSLIILAAILVLAYHPCRNPTGFLAATTVALVGFVLLSDWGSRFDPRGATMLSAQLVLASCLSLGAIGAALLANRFLVCKPAVPVNTAGEPKPTIPAAGSALEGNV